MIIDSQRREVAKKLRELETPGCIRYAEEFFEELREIVALDLDGSFEGVAGSLADLIDRPTCTIESKSEMNPWEEYELELSCGHAVEWPADQSMPKYCPWCGAEAVEGD